MPKNCKKRVADAQEPATADQIERARNLYAEGSDNDIEIDDGALQSRGGDPGTWVAAWVWVPDEDEVCFGCQEGFGCGPVDTPPGGILFGGHRFCSEECKSEYEAELARTSG